MFNTKAAKSLSTFPPFDSSYLVISPNPTASMFIDIFFTNGGIYVSWCVIPSFVHQSYLHDKLLGLG